MHTRGEADESKLFSRRENSEEWDLKRDGDTPKRIVFSLPQGSENSSARCRTGTTAGLEPEIDSDR